MSNKSVASLSNATLVDRFRKQDQSAFTELFRRHRELVYRVCMRILRHHQDAEDVVQETFDRLARSIDRFDRNRPLEPYLRTIAGNRSRTKLGRRRTSTNETISQDVAEIAISNRDDDPSQETQRILIREAIHRWLKTLPEDQATAFELVHQHGWPYQRVAEHLGHPVGTIKTWVHRNRLQLVRQLNGDHEASS
ncbi:MAG: RNA polymerase sigma factor [Planctomycetota bacterium]